MKLKLGKMKSKELAEWFGVSYATYTHHIPNYLNKLKPYCQFEEVYGGVMVIEIYTDTYDKHQLSKVKQLIIDEIRLCLEAQDGLATITGMARKFQLQGYFTSFRTARRILSIAASELFGEVKGLLSHGEAGNREYIWGVKINDYNRYRFFTPEEERIFNELITKVYSESPETIKKAALLESSLRRKEIDVDEYFELKEQLGLDTFMDCIFKFRELTGEIIVRCAKHELMESYDFIENEEA